jgi:hypothetical protein
MQIFLGAGLAAGPRGRAGREVPAPLRPPALTGAGRVGEPLGVDPGDWGGPARFAFAWLRDGAPIPGAVGRTYVPGPGDDRAAVACRVAVLGPAGAAAAETAAITITFPPPRVVGPLPDLLYTQSTGYHVVDISPFFLGSSLRFSVAGDGVAVDPATGQVTLDLAALAADGVVVVTAANSGGQVELDLRLRVATPPVLLAAPALAGTGEIGAPLGVDPGLWAGRPAPALALQWLVDGAPLAGATGPAFTPGAAEDGTEVACRVTASNPAGAAVAETAAARIAYAPPAVAGALPDLVLARGPGAETLAAAGAFAGAALRFAVEGAGATVDPATGVVSLPTEAMRVAAPVTLAASNSGGTARLGFTVTVLAVPAALAAPAPAAFARGAGPRTIAAAALFAGDALGFALEAAPAGVTIDAASGLVTVPTETGFSGEIAVRAANALGAAVQRLAVAVLAAPSALATPPVLVLDQAPGTQAVEAAAFFAGDALGFALEAAPAGVTIDAASGRVTIPTGAAFVGEIAVRAANAVGAAVQRLAVEVRAGLAAPTALAAPAPLALLQGTGPQTFSAQALFAGEALVYALDAGPAEATINAGSGLVTIPTETPFAGELALRATNAAGAATQRLALAVEATRTAFDMRTALDDVSFLYQSAAPAWSFNTNGFARLTAGADDRAHGVWALARGDGRYRALARWTAGAASPGQSRPFGLIGRMTKTGDDFRGVRVDAVLQVGGARVLQIRDYDGAGVAATTRGAAPVAWAWNVWQWFEAEFDGATVRARIWPETGPVPDWQIVATTATLAPGAFGPSTHVTVAGQTPVAQIRRLEFQPLAAAAPAAPLAGDWTLDQTMVQE